MFRMSSQSSIIAMAVLLGVAVCLGQEKGVGVEAGTPFLPISDKQVHAGMFIGVNDFEKDDSLARLSYAVNDAIGMAHMFVLDLRLIEANRAVLAIKGKAIGAVCEQQLRELNSAGVQVIDATKADIFKALQKTIGLPESPSDLLILSVSTHGFEEGGQPYVMPCEGLRAFLSDTAISLTSIERTMRRSKAGNQILFVDACRSRIATDAKELPPTMTQAFRDALAQGNGQAVLASCDVGQVSFEDSAVQHSVFTWHVLRALRGEAQPDTQGLIRLDAIERFVASQVSAWSRQNASSPQQPWIKGKTEARLIPLAVDPRALENGKDRIARLNSLAEDGKLTADEFADAQAVFSKSERDRAEQDRLEIYFQIADGKADLKVARLALQMLRGAKRRDEEPIPAVDQRSGADGEYEYFLSEAQRLIGDMEDSESRSQWEKELAQAVAMNGDFARAREIQPKGAQERSSYEGDPMLKQMLAWRDWDTAVGHAKGDKHQLECVAEAMLKAGAVDALIQHMAKFSALDADFWEYRLDDFYDSTGFEAVRRLTEALCGQVNCAEVYQSLIGKSMQDGKENWEAAKYFGGRLFESGGTVEMYSDARGRLREQALRHEDFIFAAKIPGSDEELKALLEQASRESDDVLSMVIDAVIPSVPNRPEAIMPILGKHASMEQVMSLSRKGFMSLEYLSELRKRFSDEQLEPCLEAILEHDRDAMPRQRDKAEEDEMTKSIFWTTLTLDYGAKIPCFVSGGQPGMAAELTQMIFQNGSPKQHDMIAYSLIFDVGKASVIAAKRGRVEWVRDLMNAWPQDVDQNSRWVGANAIWALGREGYLDGIDILFESLPPDDRRNLWVQENYGIAAMFAAGQGDWRRREAWYEVSDSIYKRLRGEYQTADRACYLIASRILSEHDLSISSLQYDYSGIEWSVLLSAILDALNSYDSKNDSATDRLTRDLEPARKCELWLDIARRKTPHDAEEKKKANLDEIKSILRRVVRESKNVPVTERSDIYDGLAHSYECLEMKAEALQAARDAARWVSSASKDEMRIRSSIAYDLVAAGLPEEAEKLLPDRAPPADERGAYGAAGSYHNMLTNIADAYGEKSQFQKAFEILGRPLVMDVFTDDVLERGYECRALFPRELSVNAAKAGEGWRAVKHIKRFANAEMPKLEDYLDSLIESMEEFGDDQGLDDVFGLFVERLRVVDKVGYSDRNDVLKELAGRCLSMGRFDLAEKALEQRTGSDSSYFNTCVDANYAKRRATRLRLAGNDPSMDRALSQWTRHELVRLQSAGDPREARLRIAGELGSSDLLGLLPFVMEGVQEKETRREVIRRAIQGRIGYVPPEKERPFDPKESDESRERRERARRARIAESNALTVLDYIEKLTASNEAKMVLLESVSSYFVPPEEGTDSGETRQSLDSSITDRYVALLVGSSTTALAEPGYDGHQDRIHVDVVATIGRLKGEAFLMEWVEKFQGDRRAFLVAPLVANVPETGDVRLLKSWADQITDVDFSRNARRALFDLAIRREAFVDALMFLGEEDEDERGVRLKQIAFGEALAGENTAVKSLYREYAGTQSDNRLSTAIGALCGVGERKRRMTTGAAAAGLDQN